ncbi:hypothetical protein M5G25_15910 [Pseudomonas sp. TNT2022 ID357]|uniref:Helix-turn-helix domain-containing protein n=1 Tax=Pseudomonas idahonensis TaxID=2942628 RepID=A0ABT5Q767_9PSED|nr:hypothetical protein [Pseudomonas idahonensis]MDD1149780.1 hypothetical protein [Pseudomonas idahonensis]
MSNNFILICSERQAELEAAKAAFFMSGNKVQVLEPFKLKPRGPRKDLGRLPSKRGTRGKLKRTSDSHFIRRITYIATIRELAKTMTIDQAMAATGKSESAMRRASHEGGFTFKSKVVDRERDLKLIERLTALRDAGVSRIAACRKVGISDTLLNRLVLDYDFNFPKRWEKRV